MGAGGVCKHCEKLRCPSMGDRKPAAQTGLDGHKDTSSTREDWETEQQPDAGTFGAGGLTEISLVVPVSSNTNEEK